jgi:hypothetical protein
MSITETIHDTRWRNSTILVTALFIIVQFPAQWLLSKNYYNTYVTFDSYMHLWGNVALAMIPLNFNIFKNEWNRWRYWFPLQIILATTWEIIEIIVTVFHLMDPAILSTTIENSIHDVLIAVLSVFMVNFIYEQAVEHRNLRDNITSTCCIHPIGKCPVTANQ